MEPTVKLPRKARAVVFDMDGLIFNTEELYRDATMAAAADGGHDVPLPFYLSTIGTPIEANPHGVRGTLRKRLRLRRFLDDGEKAILRDDQIAALREGGSR